jgi:hypothetical protein
LIHIFFEEGILACVLNSFGEQIAEKEGVKISRLFEETDFLMGLFNKEYLPNNVTKTSDRFPIILKGMISRNVLMFADQN